MTATVTIRALYHGTCSRCEGRWEPGDMISRDTYDGWVHESCPHWTPPRDSLDVTGDPCPDCFLYHPQGACDRA